MSLHSIPQEFFYLPHFLCYIVEEIQHVAGYQPTTNAGEGWTINKIRCGSEVISIVYLSIIYFFKSFFSKAKIICSIWYRLKLLKFGQQVYIDVGLDRYERSMYNTDSSPSFPPYLFVKFCNQIHCLLINQQSINQTHIFFNFYPINAELKI